MASKETTTERGTSTTVAKAMGANHCCSIPVTAPSLILEKAGTSRQNLTQRLNRNGLHPADLEKIAQAIGAEYISLFRFPDGKEI